MKKFMCINLLFSFLFLFTGCVGNVQNSEIKFENKYISNQDNQCMYQSGSGISNVQYGKGGYYYLKNHYLYFIDENDFSTYPICNKTDCLHDKETILDKVNNCNAKIDDTALVEKIQYYDGNIYYVSTGDGSEGYDVVYLKKFNVNTQSVDTIFTFRTVIDDWIIHRGYLYYANSLIYNTNSDDAEYVENKGSVCRVALNKTENETEKIYDFEKGGLSVLQTYNMHAYGNYVYYNAITANKNADITDLDTTNDLGKRYCFNIETAKQICLSEKIGKDKIPYYGFYHNKIIYGSFDKDNCNVYACDLNGSNGKKLFTFKKKLKAYNKFTDGKYFYFENQNQRNESNEYQSTYLIYDLKGKKINTVKMPFEMIPQIPFDTNYIIWNPQISLSSNGDSTLYVISKKEVALKKELKAQQIYQFK